MKKELQVEPTSQNGNSTKPIVRRSAFRVGDMCIAFDSNSWMKTGDIGDNSCFAKRAQVLNVRQTDDGEWLADVRFEDGRESNGHFQSGLQHCA